VIKYLEGKTHRDVRRPLINRVVRNLRAIVTGHRDSASVESRSNFFSRLHWCTKCAMAEILVSDLCG